MLFELFCFFPHRRTLILIFLARPGLSPSPKLQWMGIWVELPRGETIGMERVTLETLTIGNIDMLALFFFSFHVYRFYYVYIYIIVYNLQPNNHSLDVTTIKTNATTSPKKVRNITMSHQINLTNEKKRRYELLRPHIRLTDGLIKLRIRAISALCNSLLRLAMNLDKWSVSGF